MCFRMCSLASTRRIKPSFRRSGAGETPGYPRFQGRNRYHSFTYKEYGNGARVENGHLVLSKIGRIAVHWSRRTKKGIIAGTIKTVTISQRGGRVVCVLLL